MNNILSKVLLIGTVLLINGGNQKVNVAKSCCNDSGGKCTGSAYCSACTNCSRCGHCNSGGSCGVCAGRTTRSSGSSGSNSFYSSPNNSGSGYSNGANPSHSSETLLLIVISQELNLRAGPGTDFNAIELLTLGDQIKYLGKEDSWIYVLSPSGKKGYVYYKNVQFLNN